MAPYIIVIDMRPNGGNQLAMVITEEDGQPAIFSNEQEAEQAMTGHILSPFPRLIVDLDDAR